MHGKTSFKNKDKAKFYSYLMFDHYQHHGRIARGMSVCGGLRSFNAYAEQEDLNSGTLHVYVQDTPEVLSPGKLWEVHGYSCEWPLVKHTFQRSDRTSNATLKTLYRSLFWDCQPNLPGRPRGQSSTLHRRTPW